MMLVQLCLLLSVFLCNHITLAVIGVDLSQPFDDFNCMVQSGMEFAIMRGYRSYGVVDPYAYDTLRNIKRSGLIADVYHFPCSGVDAYTQINDLIDNLEGPEGDPYGTIWIDVEINPSGGCEWTNDINWNCYFLQGLVDAVLNRNRLVGIYSSYYQWESIFGSSGNCPQLNFLPLWYAHYDGVPSFSDWSGLQFGGWSRPSIKQYSGDQQLCGVGVDFNYY